MRDLIPSSTLRHIFTLFLISFIGVTGICQTSNIINSSELSYQCDEITPCICNSSCDPVVSGVGDPYIYPGECSIGINRYLARSASVQGLTELNHDQNPGLLECVAPYDNSYYTEYCPQKFCEMVNAMVKMDIQLLLRANTGATYHEHQLYPDDPWYNSSKQLVKDINYAYDCAGKPRPIIQTMIFEVVGASNFEAAKTHNIHLPSWIIPIYFDKYPLDLTPENLHYYYIDGQPRSTLFWELDRICEIEPDDTGNPTWHYQIDFVEMRMWFLYQAMVLIDMGYTSIHMGLYEDYCDNDFGFQKLYKLTNLFREYAHSIGSFVLLSGEPTKNESARFANTNKFIFDFDTRAMRPREISNPQVSGDGSPDCDDPISPSILSDFNNSPCASEPYPAVVDPCTINSFGGNTPGMHPLGCNVEYLPYIVHFDGFHDPVNAGHASNGPNSLTWGFNDHQWFAMLSDECQRWWFDYFFCNRREFSGGNGWISIPGTIFYDADLAAPNTDPGYESATQLISDDSEFVNLLKDNTLAPKVPTIEITTENCNTSHISNVCNGRIAPSKSCYLVGKQCYTIAVGNKDCSSVYSIHIQNQNGQWMPQQIGDTYLFCPPSTGQYTIYIRQDNLALTVYDGAYTIFDLYVLNANCCEGPFFGLCGSSIADDSPLKSTIPQFNDELVDLFAASSDQFLIYPNPASDKLIIEQSGTIDEGVKVSIYNSFGKNIFSDYYNTIGSNGSMNINMTSYAPGSYIVQIISNSKSSLYKFIKI